VLEDREANKDLTDLLNAVKECSTAAERNHATVAWIEKQAKAKVITLDKADKAKAKGSIVLLWLCVDLIFFLSHTPTHPSMQERVDLRCVCAQERRR
jgi:hypothetical protein